jgi:type VI secretion system secreted protein VgrG
MAYTQENRFIAIDTPLGDDVLLLRGFTGYEGMSRLFRFDLDLLSEDTAVPFADIVGQNVTLTIAMADGSTRYFNGFISRFAQKGGDLQFTYYQAEMVPWLWFLTRTADCRIFQNMTVPDIILQIFRDLGFSDFKVLLQGAFEPRDYCVQYRETDLNFVSRLMEQYGIFYFFEHEKDKHTLVLANSPTAHQPCPGQPRVRCDFTAHAVLDEDIIHQWQMEQELRPGKYTVTDYNFETPSMNLAVNVNSTVRVGGNDKFEVYDYPGEYLKKAEGEQWIRLRMEEEEAPHLVVRGASTCRAFTPGYRFDLEGHYNPAMDTTYVLTEVQHTATVGANYPARGAAAGESYANHFLCIPYTVPYRAPRVTPRPIVQGPQTAVVVGKAGEEIWTDKYGRVKVQFHWDREGKRNENSSCWIRVSHPWAGKSWGAVSIPRIGQEVIVDFLEGDPDQPIITGRVYNAEQMPPYGLPGGQVISGIKSNSTKGGGGYNEFVMDDTKGNELIRVHGQYDMDSTIEHDLREHVLNDRSRDVTNNETITIGNNRTETVGGNETLTVSKNRTETILGNETLSVAQNRSRTVSQNETVTVILTRTHTVGVNEAITVGGAQEITVGGLQETTVGGAQGTTVGLARSVTVGRSQDVDIGRDLTEKIGKNHKENVGDDRTTSVGKNDVLDVGKKLTINAGDEIVIKTGQASITMKKDGTIILKGKAITIDAMQKIEEKAMNITSEAKTKNVTKGAMVNVEASGINTIKGSLVKIN